MGGSAIGDGEQLRDAGLAFAALDPGEAITQRLGNNAGHALAGRLGYGIGKSVGFRVFDIEAHNYTFLEIMLFFYHSASRWKRAQLNV